MNDALIILKNLPIKKKNLNKIKRIIISEKKHEKTMKKMRKKQAKRKKENKKRKSKKI